MTVRGAMRGQRWYQALARAYRRSGLKARVTLRGERPAVRTIDHDALLARLDLTHVRPAPVAQATCELPGVDAGPMPPADTAAFTRLLSIFRPRTVLEIGTNWGCSTAMFALNTDAAARIWTVDICREMYEPAYLEANPELRMVLSRAHTGQVYRALPESTMVTQVFRDSRLLDWTEAAFPAAFDLVLVDACHEYAFARSDAERTWPRVAPGGLLVWHDYYPEVTLWPGVFRAVNEFARTVAPVVHLEGTALAIAVKARA